MVQLSNILTVMVASTSMVSASHNMRRATQEAGAKAAVNNFQDLLSTFSNSIGSNTQIQASDLQAALQSYVSIIQTMTQLPFGPSALNTTGFTPNWEGAAIGGVINALIGLQVGAVMGMTTQWTIKGANDGLTSILGFDPMAALAAQGLPGMPVAAPATPPVVPSSTPSPAAAPKPSVPAAPVAAPKPVTPVAPVSAPKPPVAPVSAPKPPVAPVAPALPKASGMAGMAGMAGMSGHAHGGM